jgi:Mor family transcriptional regulator
MKRYERIERVKKLIGEKKTLGLIFLMSGEHWTVPKNSSLHRTKRDAGIEKNYRSGMPFKELARKYGLSDRWVRRIIERINRMKEDDLFTSKK